MRTRLNPGAIIIINEGEYYKITGKVVGEGGGSLVYPCIRLIKNDEDYKEVNNLRYAIKECFPVSSEYSFIRNQNSEIVSETDDQQAISYLNILKQMQLREQQITGKIYQKGFRLIPIMSQSENVEISLDEG